MKHVACGGRLLELNKQIGGISNVLGTLFLLSEVLGVLADVLVSDPGLTRPVECQRSTADV